MNWICRTSRAADVRGHDPFHAHRLSGGILAGGDRTVLRLSRHRIRPDQAGLSRQPDLPAVRHHLERPAAGDSVLHLHGRDPRTLRPRRGPARFLRPAVRPGARRPVLRGDLRRRHSRRHHRHRRGLGHRHGRDLDDADAQIRLLDAPHHGRHRRLRHHHAAHSAVAGAGRAGRPARPLGRRHVCRRDRAQHHPDRAVLRLGADRQFRRGPTGRAGAAAGGAHAARAGRSGSAACAA